MKTSEPHRSYFGLDFIATGAETNGQYFLSKTRIPAGDPGPPSHTHQNEDESFYLLHGEVIFSVQGKEITLHAGEFLNIEKGEKHTWRNEGREDATLIVTFTPAGIEHMFIELDQDVSQIQAIGKRYGTTFEV
ncbi:MAG: cupin domain-containing protein [Leptolyngbya sp. SIO3F4]|nr:cupin domain-containing protein [Leptolyngbya sp. SIO3F4]